MTLPAFKAVGTGSETAPAWPTHVAGDFGMLFTSTTSGTISTPSGWTLIAPTPVDNNNGVVTLQAWYRFATSSSETAPSISNADYCWGVVETFTGVSTTHPIHQVAVSANQGTGGIPGHQTYVATCLVVFATAWGTDQAGAAVTTFTSPGVGSLTSRYDAGTATGGGGGIYLADGTMVTAGSFTHGDITLVSGIRTANAVIVLTPTDKSFGQKSRTLNTRM